MDAAIGHPPEIAGITAPEPADRGRDECLPIDPPAAAPATGPERNALTVPGDYAIEVVGGDLSAKAEMGRITIEAIQSITLKVGRSSITIDHTGITIRGLTIEVEAALQTGVKGLRTEIKAAGLLHLDGGLTRIG